jgi:hypothetical protein
MHRLLIAALLSLFATVAEAAPVCQSMQACIDSGRGYCRYAVLRDGSRCWSHDRKFLASVKKSGKRVTEARVKPDMKKEPSSKSEPRVQREPHVKSEPLPTREPQDLREPNHPKEPVAVSEPSHMKETEVKSGPVFVTEPRYLSEPYRTKETKMESEPFRGTEPSNKSGPIIAREPRRESATPSQQSNLDVTLLGIFTFAVSFMGAQVAMMFAGRMTTVPPPPLDLANSPYRLVPGATPGDIHPLELPSWMRTRAPVPSLNRWRGFDERSATGLPVPAHRKYQRHA